MQSFQIGKNEAGQRLDKFLHKFMPSVTHSFICKMLRKKNIVLNGKKVEGREILAVDDTVSFFFSDETYHLFTGNGKVSGGISNTEHFGSYHKAYEMLHDISVIYDDKDILILNKPAGILTQKSKPEDITLNEWMIGYLLYHNKITEEALKTFKPSVQNRLDRNTSGLVLCGVSLRGSQMLSKLIHDRAIKKFYVTIVKGEITTPGVLNGTLQKNEKQNKVTISVGDIGKDIITAFKPVSHGKDYTYMEIELITGKPHQIRAHMASIGHPILGDPKYGDRNWNQTYFKKTGTNRQLLHAYRVVFPPMAEPFCHLSNQEWIAELPKDIQEVIY